MKYAKPELQRYGTFREVTRNFQWCWVFPDLGICTPPSSTTNPGGEEEGNPSGEDRS